MSTPRLLVLLVVVPAMLVAAARPAAAERDRSKRLLGTVGFTVGAADVADVSGSALGLHLDLGHSWGAFHVQGEYAMTGFTETRQDALSPRSAILQRAGVLFRYHLLNKGLNSDKFLLNVWLQGGLARQYWRWTGGGALERDELVIGFGFGFLGDLAKYDAKRSSWLGFHYDFRFTIADSPYGQKHEAVVCAGPCDYPTGPIPVDLGFMFIMGFQFGR